MIKFEFLLAAAFLKKILLIFGIFNESNICAKVYHIREIGSPTTKWRPRKIFAKLNGNHLSLANIFKLHKHQTFGLMKMHNMFKT